MASANAPANDPSGHPVTAAAGRPQVRLLGPVDVVVGTVSEAVVGRQGAVLAMLALDAGRSVSTDRLIDEVWGEEAPRTVRASLQVHISQLRKRLNVLGVDGAVVTRSTGYALSTDVVDIDVVQFIELSAAARRALDAGSLDEAVSLSTRSLALWRGDPLDGIQSTPFAAGASVRLTERRLDVVEVWADALTAVGSLDEVARTLEHEVSRHPYRESLWQRLVLALYRAGRRVDAIDRLGSLRRLLSSDLGVRPGTPINELEAMVLDGEPEVAGERHQSRPRLSGPGRQLPAIKDLLGREALTGEVAERSRSTRVATLVGPGGVGKTSVAVNVAASRAHEMSDGVWFIDLGRVSGEHLVISAVAAALGTFSGEEGLTVDALVDVLLDAHALLVLDNCEHVIDEAARVIDELVTRCRRLSVLATSRERLDVPGESVVVVEPLDEQAALALMLQRAGEPAASRDSEWISELRNVCDSVDRLPLGIELVAARLSSLSPGVILEQIRRGNGLDLRSRGAVQRHQSMRETIAWSYDLLSPAAQTLLRRLAVFEGGATLDLIVDVCGDPDGALDGKPVAALVDSLVGASLLSFDHTLAPGRYRLLETVKSFGQRQLGESEAVAVRTKHADAMIDWGHRVRLIAESPAPAAAYRSLISESSNLRAAYRWSVGRGDDVRSARLIGAPGAILLRASGVIHELDDWIRETLTSTSLAPADRLAVLLVAAHHSGEPSSTVQGWTREAYQLATELGDDASSAFAQYLLSHSTIDIATDTSEAAMRSIIARLEDTGCFTAAGYALCTLANLLLRQHRYDDVAELLERRIERSDRYGGSECFLLYQLARMLIATGHLDAAATRCEQAMQRAITCENTLAISYATFGKALFADATGDVDAALDLYDRAVLLDVQLGDKREILNSRMQLVVLAAQTGDVQKAQSQLRAIELIADAHPGPREIALRSHAAGIVAAAMGDRQRACQHLIEAMQVLAPTAMGEAFVEALRTMTTVVGDEIANELSDIITDIVERRRLPVDVLETVLGIRATKLEHSAVD